MREPKVTFQVDGKVIITIRAGGSHVEIAEGVDVDDSARVFWTAVEQAMGSRPFVGREAYRARIAAYLRERLNTLSWTGSSAAFEALIAELPE